MAESDQRFYVYGIVPSDVETEPDARGVGDPPGEVTTIKHGDVAALVSAVAADSSLGSPEDLAAHAALLDGAAAAAPVLPIKFGAVLTSEDDVTEELLAAHHDEFAAALRELEGKAQYVVRGRYRQEAIFKEILAENAELGRLREAIRDKPEDATRNERMALGEAITNAISAKRDADTETVRRALDDLGLMTVVREPTHDEDAAHVVFLAETDKESELEEAVERLATGWEGRVDLRLLGPLAAYDFVVSKAAE
ncbi:GvpL/GvpF family gas vesicle protein [Actinophytocola glycyrrhizae]|uniref:GvpL/GvpF family gas vesicle protein n=1 Tax=Actinophytocola glycyrrhizae TaxID=2044873 RepID=A0ABV9S046_9PSEU